MGNPQTIAGVELLPRKRLDDERGAILKVWSASEGIGFEPDAIGEVYLSLVKRNVVKGWHLHKEMTLRYVCVVGRILVGLYDNRPTSPTRGMSMRVVLADSGPDYQMLVVRPGIWNGFRSLTGQAAMVLNVPDMPHDPHEIERMPPQDAPWPFDWGGYEYGG